MWNKKKVEKPAPSTSNLLGMIKNSQEKQMGEPIASAPLGPSAPPENN